MTAAASRGVHGRMCRKAPALRVTRQRGGRSDLACGAVLETIPELCAAQGTRSGAHRWRAGWFWAGAWAVHGGNKRYACPTLSETQPPTRWSMVSMHVPSKDASFECQACCARLWLLLISTKCMEPARPCQRPRQGPYTPQLSSLIYTWTVCFIWGTWDHRGALPQPCRAENTYFLTIPNRQKKILTRPSTAPTTPRWAGVWPPRCSHSPSTLTRRTRNLRTSRVVLRDRVDPLYLRSNGERNH
jgi:hypothetical protein